MAASYTPTASDFQTAGPSAGHGVFAVFGSVRAFLKRRAEYNRVVTELSQFDARGLSDLGIAPADIERLAQEAAEQV